jgi:hypothetical protein
MDGCQRLRALLQQPLAAIVIEAAVNSRDDRLAVDGVAD